METVIKIVQFILSFSILILIHELGHFMFARMFKMKVEKFYLFFNPGFSIFRGKKVGGKFRTSWFSKEAPASWNEAPDNTEYGIGWVPFGGYCKIAGMVDESMDKEQMSQPPKADEYRSRPAWQRLLVISGGVIMNVVLALCIYIGMSYVWGEKYIANKDMVYGYAFSDLGKQIGFRNGDKILAIDGKEVKKYKSIYFQLITQKNADVMVLRGGDTVQVRVDEFFTPQLVSSEEPLLMPRTPFVVDSILSGGGAQKAGMAKGDSITGVDGQDVVFFDQFTDALAQHKGETVEISLVRDSAGTKLTKTLPVEVSEDGRIEAARAMFDHFVKVTHTEYSFWQSFPAGIQRTGNEISNYWKQFKMIFNPKTKAYKSLGGPIAIGSIFPSYWSFEEFWRLTGFLSIVLAIMNILPIPALDGGHIFFLLVEVITRRKPSDKVLEIAQWIGLIFIFALMAFAMGNDIYRFFIK